MSLKLTVKQIAEAQVAVDLVEPIFNYGARNAPNVDVVERNKLYSSFRRLKELVKELNDAELSVKG